MIALIPARAGSKRIPRKNVKELGGHPLIAWTIAAARQSGVFADVLVSTDDSEASGIAMDWDGVIVDYPRPSHLSADDSPDIGWVRYALNLSAGKWESFAILRPTSPFRTAETIQRAYAQFKRQEVHSIRAVEPVKQHPGKMWRIESGCLKPIIEGTINGTPFHSSPTQALPKVYVQNASLEMAYTYVVKSFGTISGTKVAPFYTHGYEGVDLNTPEDWARAEQLIAEGLVEFPRADVAGVSSAPAQI
jgi:N-acylneuraminate cytidylyltransferase